MILVMNFFYRAFEAFFLFSYVHQFLHTYIVLWLIMWMVLHSNAIIIIFDIKIHSYRSEKKVLFTSWLNT